MTTSAIVIGQVLIILLLLIVGGVSYGTPVGDTVDFYRTIPIQPTAYGQGLTFLMLTEALRL